MNPNDSQSHTYFSQQAIHENDAPVNVASDPTVRAAARQLVDSVRKYASENRLSPDAFAREMDLLGHGRGQPLTHPLLSGGVGRGAFVRLADGREVLDLVSGIGPYVFGHADPDLLETAVVAAASDVAFQGHVLPGSEYARLTQELLRHAGARMSHAWLSISGSMANENAAKILFQKKSPANRMIAFDHAFHGRTLAMAEMTDRPEYREGIPIRGFIDRVPFYDASDPQSTQRSVQALDALLEKNPGAYAAFCFELVQGEGGFNHAPASFFQALMKVCKTKGVAVWLDEIQTFGRSPGLFAFRTLGLDEFVDVVTIGKILHGSATLFTDEYRPRPKLVAGTWAGSTVGMAIGARILHRLESEGYLGPEGLISDLCDRIDAAFAALEERMPGVIRGRSGLGAMQAFTAWDGNPAVAAEIITACLSEGVLFQTAGDSPMKIRMLPPLNLTQEELDWGFAALERGLRRVAKTHDLSI